MNDIGKIGFGGSCHWCTEAIFQSLKGVKKVEQGWVSSEPEPSDFSESVIVHFDKTIISLETLIAVHLHTHSSTSFHSMRIKYRSAIYVFNQEQHQQSVDAIADLQKEFDSPIITAVLLFHNFKLNQESYLDYYYRNPEKPFCENIINPKLRLLVQKFENAVEPARLEISSLTKS